MLILFIQPPFARSFWIEPPASPRVKSVAPSGSLANQVIAEVGPGDVVGEHSCINKGKCEASVRAKGSVELLVVPRESMLKLTQRNPLIKHRLHVLMNTRFAENLYLMRGKLSSMISSLCD